MNEQQKATATPGTTAVTLDAAAQRTLAAEVVRMGEKLTLPAGMGIPRAIELLKAREAYEQQDVAVSADINCFPWDGADIDRVTAGERNVEMDDILNIIDGIDAKTANIIVVLTTNELEAINPAMLRPGRLDAVINVLPPDGPAVEKLIRLYGRGVIDPKADLTKAGELLSGKIPAIVAEVVKRAKLAQLKHTPEGQKIGLFGEQALVEAALTIRAQSDLLDKLMTPDETPEDKLGRALVETISQAQSEGRIQ